MKISYSGCPEPIGKAANWRKRKKYRKLKKKLYLREVYQISFTAFPGGSSMENAGLDPASSCSEHSCLRQGPGGILSLFWRLKGTWGLWWPPAQSHFCSWVLGWHRSLGVAGVVSLSVAWLLQKQHKLCPSSALLWGCVLFSLNCKMATQQGGVRKWFGVFKALLH